MPKNLNIEELRKQGLNNLADLIEAKEEDKDDSKEDDKESDEDKDDMKDDDKKPEAGKKGVNPFAAKESVDALFVGVEGLTEEFKAKAEVTFITAVTEAAEILSAEKMVALEESVTAQLVEQAKVQEASIDSYLTYVSEQWLEENKEAVESKLQTKLTESFMTGLRDLFEAHNIEIPEAKQDLVEAVQSELALTQDALKEAIEKIQMMEAANELTEKCAAVDALCVGLSETEAEKFHGLAKEFLSEDAASFKIKINAIKEYFTTAKETVTPVVEAVVVVDVPADLPVVEAEEAPTKKVDDKMKSYLSAIRSTSRK